jgi:hypothetical protein
LDETDSTEAIFPLSDEVRDLVQDGDSLTKTVISLLDNSEVLYESAWAASVMVFRINENLVIKAGQQA